ncbi:UDP-N-acetylglucosamine 1-carboxyvinyltransferase [Collibacillus ludicampi]|uniref:UDP-N-acetylglucosamine 1-carboxyvinyltransferase n=1 Tax=Collibacillus ludicampi TaxID=2771369 RepID=A0AAV4LI14_9BACL|nr:UDP-N-acetylglucosamine 1-carboxyvinyltransferase [Collibacillus ludicampi]GIM47455.1 UDP-N-acetylglucosamine 1-carboxyvinyltransferase [Collibacillus ludicampi]
MERLAIVGGRPLTGSVRVHGAKNAALPILAASVLAAGKSTITDVPDLKDIRVMSQILESLGAKVSIEGRTAQVDSSTIHTFEVPEEMMRQMRSSIFLMGPILARFGTVRVSKPGGCTIGSRPIDLHLKGLKALGANIEEKGGYIQCTTERLRGDHIYLDIPSVGTTENLMMAATLAEGTTTIGNAAREPEIVDLARFLNKMGAKISGAGEDTITIQGVEELRPTRHTIIPDRIVAGTFLLAGAITRGDIRLINVIPGHLGVVLTKLREAGVEIKVDRDIINVRSRGELRAVDRIQTAPYPGFPTDLQAPFMSLLTIAKGSSIVSETIFEERFKHVSELRRMGANIKVDLRTAFVQGVSELTAASVEASDLRAGAALVIAALAAKGVTHITGLQHIDRGYERIEDVLNSLGARAWRIKSG